MTSKKFIPRSDHVGSLLRPASVSAARKNFFQAKTITLEELTNVEDKAILDLVEMQESIGLHVVTDGEVSQ